MINSMLTKAYLTVALGLDSVKSKLKSEKGDTNFISIIIILGIVLVVAALFIAFKDQIVGWVEEIVNGFDIKGTKHT